MAFVDQPFELVVSFADNSGEVVTRNYRLQDTDYADILTGLSSWIPTIAATTDDVIVSYFVKSIFVNDAIVLPAAGVQSENQAIISGKIEGQPLESFTVTIPAPKIGVFTATSGKGANIVNQAASIVTSFMGLFASGGAFYVSDGEFPAAGWSGKRRHTKNNNG